MKNVTEKEIIKDLVSQMFNNKEELAWASILKETEDRVTYACLEGYSDPLKFMSISKILEETAKTIRRAANESAIIEAEKYDKKEVVSNFGVKIERSQSVKYVFKGSAFELINEKISSLNELLKEAKAISKKTRLAVDFVDPSTGEGLNVEPAVKQSTDILKLSFLK